MEYNNVCLYPDSRLYEPTSLVEKVTEEVLQLGESLLRIAIDINAAGLAAPQIGQSIKAAVIREAIGEEEKSYFIMNPEIIEKSEEMEDSWEGCMSLPGLQVPVKRYSKITVRYMNVKEEYVTLKCSGLLSRAFQHEIDHLNNILLVDRMSNTQKKRNRHYFKNLEKFCKKLAKKQDICNTSI